MQPIPIVSDSGPILSFARADQFNLLRAVVQELIVPQAVWDEIVVQGRRRPASRSVETANWIRLQQLSNPETAERLSERLHRGEREAIALAVELQAALLVDDSLAREMARRLK